MISKNLKMKNVIALFAIIVSIVCIGAIFIASSVNVSSILKDSTVDSMKTALNLQSGVINEFVQSMEMIILIFLVTIIHYWRSLLKRKLI